MKNNRGEITIGMIITVIILIILGGICIFMLTGENGIFVPKRDKVIVNTNNENINDTTDNQLLNVNNNQEGANIIQE